MVLDGKSSQDYPVNAGIPQRPILGCTLFLMMLSVAIHTDDTTLYSKIDQVSDLWQQLDLASELESDLRDTGLG